MAQFHYDQQVRRFLIQFGRIFSGWKVQYGNDQEGNPILVEVPVQYGNASRNAATIIANNSASNLPHAPMITYYISGMEYDQRRTQDPTFVNKLQIRQRAWDESTGQYLTTQGNAFTVERHMPVPYNLAITVDIWVTNELQRQQIFEQLGTLFNPGLEIQSTDNFVDWTSLSVVYQDKINWSSRTIPVGTGNPIDVMTWSFHMPIWISAPAKVRKMNVIHRVIAGIFDGSTLESTMDDRLLMGNRMKITKYGYQLLLIGSTLQLIPEKQPDQPPNSDLELPNSPPTDAFWTPVLNEFGAIQPGISQIWIQNPYMDHEIVGTITPDPLDDRFLIYNIDPDTLPQNTLQPVDAVINPQQKAPGIGLPTAVQGRRYIIVDGTGDQEYNIGYIDGDSAGNMLVHGDWAREYVSGQNVKLFNIITGPIALNDVEFWVRSIDDSTIALYRDRDLLIPVKVADYPVWTQASGGRVFIGADPNAWKGTGGVPLVAQPNDIIEFNGEFWYVAYAAAEHLGPDFVLNLSTDVQYRWAAGRWMKSWEGWVQAGDWDVVI